MGQPNVIDLSPPNSMHVFIIGKLQSSIHNQGSNQGKVSICCVAQKYFWPGLASFCAAINSMCCTITMANTIFVLKNNFLIFQKWDTKKYNSRQIITYF